MLLKSAMVITVAIVMAVTTAFSSVEISTFYAPGILLSGLLVFQLFEAFTCYKQKSPEEQKKYNWGRVWLKKSGTWMLWVGVLWLDGIAKTIPGLVTDHHFPLLESPLFFPFTTTYTFLVAGSEYLRYAANISRIQGPTSDARWAMFLFRVVTVGGIQKWLASGNPGQMPSRITDGLTLEDFQAAIDYYRSGGKTTPPDWLIRAAPDHIPTIEELERMGMPLPPDRLEAIRQNTPPASPEPPRGPDGV